MEEDNDDLHLTTQELVLLSDLDSTYYGFLPILPNENAKIRFLLMKAVKNLEGLLIKARKQKLAQQTKQSQIIKNNENLSSNDLNLNLDSKVKEETMDIDIEPQEKVEKSNKGDPNTMADGTPIKLEVEDIEMEDLSLNEIERVRHLQRDKEKAKEEVFVDPKTYCTLGHFNLLLEENAKALSAYRIYLKLRDETYWRDKSFLYGIGLIYFNLNYYQL
ncbi:uncharacterized protein LOC129615397 [Condylostylus longicornis]|uniref:uncharacterized protein LOC129615397 n=1 Tax=Condylostylus longicornis TaxID=2530218 RepID=UPI00244DA399|nr:uncharacterized protein LOC129615397 [Condylostylus longicornis]